jgi:hypothetical protein
MRVGAAAAGSFALGAGIAVIAMHWFIVIPSREEFLTALTDFDLQQAEQLRLGKTASVLEAYEHRVDMYVRGWGPPTVRPEALIAAVAAYRATHPRKTADPAHDEAVRLALEPRAVR